MDTHKPTLSTPAAVLLAGVIIAGAIVYAFGFAPNTKGTTDTAKTPETKPIPAVTESDYRLGAAQPKLILVEYSDLECPFCGQFHPAIKQVAEELSGEVQWVYRHFPLTQIHQNALPAALAAECVGQMKGNAAFWTYINGVFAQQKLIGKPLIESLAGVQGISATDLEACMAKDETLAIVQKQFNDAVAAGGQGTPFTIILDSKGKQVATLPGSMAYAQLKAQVEALLAKAR